MYGETSWLIVGPDYTGQYLIEVYVKNMFKYNDKIFTFSKKNGIQCYFDGILSITYSSDLEFNQKVL